MNGQPYFSLVVPTLGRTTELARMLESLAHSTCRDFECIVVDQNRDDRLASVLAPFGDRFPLRRLRVDFRGAARARNHGARRASGRVLNFPDDDCELTPALLADVRARLEARPVKVLIGMCVDRDGAASTTRFARDERPLSAWSMWNRNIEFTMFFDRATFARAGGYDERFGVGAEFGSDEGAELLIRLLRALPAGQVRYDHRLRFLHPDKARDASPAGAARAYGYARGSGALLAKWPIAPVIAHSARVLLGAAAAAATSTGGRRRLYLGRLRGFASGFLAYRGRAAQ
jgi:glycosyltransferase involved in cell wall biosynthesis